MGSTWRCEGARTGGSPGGVVLSPEASCPTASHVMCTSRGVGQQGLPVATWTTVPSALAEVTTLAGNAPLPACHLVAQGWGQGWGRRAAWPGPAPLVTTQAAAVRPCESPFKDGVSSHGVSFCLWGYTHFSPRARKRVWSDASSSTSQVARQYPQLWAVCHRPWTPSRC